MLNIILSLILISSMREMGIALATAISAWVNATLLFIILISKRNLDLDRQFFINVFKLGLSLFFIIFTASKTFALFLPTITGIAPSSASIL